MPWTPPRTWIAGETVTAAIGNTHWRDNQVALRGGSIAIASQAAKEIIFASSAAQLSRDPGLLYTTDPFPYLTIGSGANALYLVGNVGSSVNPHGVYPHSVVSAWASISNPEGTPTVQAGHNVASLSLSAPGVVVVTFATPLTTAAYCAQVTPIASAPRIRGGVDGRSTTGLGVWLYDDATQQTVNASFMLLVVGG